MATRPVVNPSSAKYIHYLIENTMRKFCNANTSASFFFKLKQGMQYWLAIYIFSSKFGIISVFCKEFISSKKKKTF